MLGRRLTWHNSSQSPHTAKNRPWMLLVAIEFPTEDFVQIPGVAHPPVSAPQRPRIRRAEDPTPLSNRPVGHGDAALGEQIFNISEAQADAMVEPHCVTDDHYINCYINRVQQYNSFNNHML